MSLFGSNTLSGTNRLDRVKIEVRHRGHSAVRLRELYCLDKFCRIHSEQNECEHNVTVTAERYNSWQILHVNASGGEVSAMVYMNQTREKKSLREI